MSENTQEPQGTQEPMEMGTKPKAEHAWLQNLVGDWKVVSEMVMGPDKKETSEVRQQSAASLRNLAPERFEAAAKEIATDPEDDPEVRTACLTTLAHLGDTARVYGDDDFIQRLADVGGDESAPQVAEGARSLIERRPPG